MAIIPRPVIEIVINGLELGIVLAFLVGPVFFTILQTSIERGFGRGVLVAIGVSASDTMYVLICYFGFAKLMTNENLQVYMAYVGGTLLVGFGFYHFLVKSRAKPLNQTTSVVEKRLYRYVIKGFLINGMTPTVLFFWIGTVSLATINFGYSEAGQFAFFFVSLLGTVLATDILKAYLADKLRLLMTPRASKIINIVLGVIMIFFGARLILLAKTITFI